MIYSSISFPAVLASMLAGLVITDHSVDSAVVTDQVDQITDGDVTPSLQVSWFCHDTCETHVVELHPTNVSGSSWYVLCYLINGVDGRALFDAWSPVNVALVP